MKYGKYTWGQLEAICNKIGGEIVMDGILNGTLEVITKVVSYIVATFTILVDETQTVEDLVKAGKFNWSNENIVSKNFPKPQDGKKVDKEVVLFHFAKNMSSEAVITEMDKAGYKPATIWCLLGLAVKEPNLQKKFPIVALGSVVSLDGLRQVPCLFGDASARYLYLCFFGSVWYDFYRFLGVRK